MTKYIFHLFWGHWSFPGLDILILSLLYIMPPQYFPYTDYYGTVGIKTHSHLHRIDSVVVCLPSPLVLRFLLEDMTFGTLLSHIDHKQVKIICTYTRPQAGDSAVKGKITLNIPIYCLICWRVLVSVDPSIVFLSKLTTLITKISSYSISTWMCSYKIIIKFCIPALDYGPRAYCALKQQNKLLEILYYTTCYKCRLTWN